MTKRVALDDFIAGLRDQVDRLTERRGSLPAELEEVRRRLAEARADLGAAVLEGKDTSKLTDAVTALEAEERKLSAALDASGAKLDALTGDLDQAQRDELLGAIMAADGSLAADAAGLLGDLYSTMNRLEGLSGRWFEFVGLRADAKRRGVGVPALEAGDVGGLFIEAFKVLHGVTEKVEVSVGLTGRPAAFAPVVKERRKTHKRGA